MAELVVVVAQTLVATGVLTALAPGDPPPGGPEDGNGALQNSLDQCRAAGDVVKEDQRRAGTTPIGVEGTVEVLTRDAQGLAGSLQQSVKEREPQTPVRFFSQGALKAKFQDVGDEFVAQVVGLDAAVAGAAGAGVGVDRYSLPPCRPFRPGESRSRFG
ncbi:MAG: hypothetical protein QN204_08170, partial [Armatimonadota bacterium]|nr:hypothetical protein [Armatimonadota bacterium]